MPFKPNREEGNATVSRSRRAFMRALPAGGLAVAATLTGTESQAAGEPAANKPGDYVETDHIRRYYELSRK